MTATAGARMLDVALDLAGRRWPVFPLHTADANGRCSCGKGAACKTPGKHPRWHKDDLTNGLNSATTDEAHIRP